MWWLEAAGKLSPAQQDVITRAAPGRPLLVSDFTLWEMACLYDLGRLAFSVPLGDWLRRATAPPLVRVCPVNPEIAAQVAALPASFHRDPADRVIVATALVEGATLLTRDERIINSGLVTTL